MSPPCSAQPSSVTMIGFCQAFAASFLGGCCIKSLVTKYKLTMLRDLEAMVAELVYSIPQVLVRETGMPAAAAAARPLRVMRK